MLELKKFHHIKTLRNLKNHGIGGVVLTRIYEVMRYLKSENHFLDNPLLFAVAIILVLGVVSVDHFVLKSKELQFKDINLPLNDSYQNHNDFKELYGMKIVHLLILQKINNCKESTVSTLCEEIRIHPSTIYNVLKTLADKGWF